MNFAEILIFIALAFGVFFCLTPIQRALEIRLIRFFRSKRSGSGPVIDITDYSKKKDKK